MEGGREERGTKEGGMKGGREVEKEGGGGTEKEEYHRSNSV